MKTTHAYRCCCGEMWDAPGHSRTMARDTGVGQWKGHPGQMIPHRQWTRENLPAVADGFVVAGDDGFARQWTATDPVGVCSPIEWKTYGATLDVPTRFIFDILSNDHERIRTPLVIRLSGGNSPGALRHYPHCAECDLPEPVVVAKSITVNGDTTDERGLVDLIVSHLAARAAA